MAANPYVRVTELDFAQIKENLKSFLQSQSQFSDYDFEGSNLNVLLDLLAYNTHYNAVLANMASNEMFIDTALKRSSVASLAKMLAYTPRSRRAARARLSVSVFNIPNGPNYATLERFTKFSIAVDNTIYNYFTTDSYVTEPIGGVYTWNNVDVYEGRELDFYWTVPPQPTPATKFVIPNADIDIESLQIAVQYGGSGSYIDVYTRVTDITQLSPNSKVFFVEENSEGLYQIYFGDGILGENLSAGDIIRARYIVTSGAAGNVSANIPLTWFSNSILGETAVDKIITTITAPTGGLDAETTDQLRFNARNNYVAGNRTITTSDFANAITQAIPGAQSVNCWGGESNVPPRYGTIFISVKPYDGYVLTDLEKIRLVNNVLAPRSLPTLEYAFVDPEYVYIGVDVYLKYRTATTTRSAQQIQSLALQKVQEYFDSNLEKFNAGFYTSQLQESIQNMDPSIISNILVIRQQKRFSPVIGELFSADIQYPGKIHPAELISTFFVYYDGANFVNAYLGDEPDESPPNYEGTGRLNIYDAATNTVLDTVGTVNYATGLVTIDNLSISGYVGDTTIRLTSNLQQASRDLLPRNNEIIVLDDTRGNPVDAAINGISVNVISTTS
jgi:hypothetical protein